MKRKNLHFLTLLFVLICTIQLQAQNYEFPLNPSMKEWKTLPVDVKDAMLQIPDDKLRSMTTESLIQSFIDFPHVNHLFYYNTYKAGFQRVYSEFNGLRELLTRKDLPDALINYYEKMDVNDYERFEDLVSQGRSAVNFMLIEILLTQPEVSSKFSQQQSKTITDILLKKYTGKVQHVKHYSIVGISCTAYSIGHIIRFQDVNISNRISSDDVLSTFLCSGHTSELDVLNQIIEEAINFIAN